MNKYIKSEWLKQKHSFNKVLLWMAPLVTFLLTILLMGGIYLQSGMYNFWYTLVLPGGMTMFTAFTASREGKKNRHGLFGVVVEKKKLWMAQIILNTFYLFITCMVFFIFVTIAGLLFGNTIPVVLSLGANLLLFICFAWQIPLWMFVTEKMGVFTAILFSVVCNMVMAIIFAGSRLWWAPFAIPARLMCSVIGISPNGLPLEVGSKLSNTDVILPGVVISLVLYILLTFITLGWFNKREV